MDRPRVLAALSVSTILVVTLLSGPAIGVVDLTQPRIDTAGIGTGNATIDTVEAPDTVRFDRGLQSESYYLEVPDVRLHVASVSGQPTLGYRISIPEMGYSRGSTHFLNEDDVGWITVSLAREAFPEGRFTQSTYDGTLSVVLRYNGTERVVYEGSVTVEVTE